MNIKLIGAGQSCEINCIYCKRNWYHERGVSKRSPDEVYDEVVSFVNSLKDKNDALVVLSGIGEPLLLPNLLEICKYLNNYSIPFYIETNGIKFSSLDLLRELKELGLRIVILNVFSVDENNYDLISDSKGNFQKFLKALKNLEDLRIPIIISIPILKQNVTELDKIPYFIKENFKDLIIYEVSFKLLRINSPPELFLDVAFRLSEYSEEIEEKILKLKNDFKITFAQSTGALLFCFFKKITKEFNLDKINYLSDNERMKTKYCNLCYYKDICLGPTKTYIELFGDEEFKERYFKDKI